MKLTWMEDNPTQKSGVAWGVPWAKGKLNREDSLVLQKETGELVRIQSWPTAYWPDGSIKWTGQAAVIDGISAKSYELKVTANKTKNEDMSVKDSHQTIEIDTGNMTCVLHKKGKTLIKSLTMNGVEKGKEGKLIAVTERRTVKGNESIRSTQQHDGEIISVEVEQVGPVRTVVKVEGEHTPSDPSAKMPFIVRLYLYAETETIRIVHTFLYDGDAENHFIKGLGIEISPSITGEAWNRHVHVTGDTGVYSEPAQLVQTRRFKGANGLYKKQIDGEILQEELESSLKAHVIENAIWNDFKVVQDSATHYKFVKRTNDGYSWIDSLHGKRSRGVMYAGGETGGIAAGIKDFWQKHPSALEVNKLSTDEAKMTLWFWSPDGEIMDFRHYSEHTHVTSAYEGFDEMRATPKGIANTSEAYLKCYTEAPAHQELEQLTTDWQAPPLLVCEPEYYYETEATGVWSLPNYQNPAKANLEKQLDAAFTYYKKEIDQRSWYGYWNYGDVMHTYDAVRHQWNYDMGGFAWQNTELVPNLWLWYSFFRTGRKDIFKMAEAMTRHTSEVDQYHLGEYAGLGSRHNVSHWGCGCKEARISMAGLHKYYYFLTTDERTRDLLEDVRDAEQATVNLDPMREFFPKDEHPTHARVGPDWAAFCSNWFSEWERTEDKKYRDKLMTGMNDLKQLPFRLLSGPTFGFDPKTSHLHHLGDGNSGGYHMVIAFGAPQVWMEMAHVMKDEEWKDMLVEFGQFYLYSDAEKREKSEGILSDEKFHWPMFAAGMGAYAAAKKQDSEMARKTWNLLLNKETSHTPLPIETEVVSGWTEIEEIPWITTNTISQWCLNTITALELIGDCLPELDEEK
ncbi:hypothetical protein CR203_15425 [Salipaludibacillus neizhouensis]|uniref:Tat pathway signal sequence domain protein n=1 Tax=Salipaludibacillus neizhouensis TaxID=885475 RepID=A0A3A9JZF8_9BACI|nr:hypothetical protein [Salipaludibacillus neizhouensis]RKL66284.1 hypothetical protein CR203_15425 [Salipaludibacillus neizhouensis]